MIFVAVELNQQNKAYKIGIPNQFELSINSENQAMYCNQKFSIYYMG
jgi:hypothetical protein